MKLKSLTIRRTESYQTPSNTLVGTVDLIEEGGAAMTVVLSPQAIIKICDYLQLEVGQRAKVAANAAQTTMREAAAELLLEAHPMIQGEVSLPEPL